MKPMYSKLNLVRLNRKGTDMVKIDSGEIDTFVSNLENNELLLISGFSSEGICMFTKNTIINTANSGGKVAVFNLDNGCICLSDVDQTDKGINTENITVFLPGSTKEDDIEIINRSSIASIKKELDKRLKENIKYDLIVIDGIEKTYDFIYDKQYMYSICKYLKTQMKEYPAPVIAVTNDIFEIYSSDGYLIEDVSDKLFYDIRDVVDFFMIIDDNLEDNEDPVPSQLFVRIVDCRVKELDLSYLYSSEDSRICKKEGKVLSLYDKAIAMGLACCDAAAYATYWNDDNDDDELSDFLFSQEEDEDITNFIVT